MSSSSDDLLSMPPLGQPSQFETQNTQDFYTGPSESQDDNYVASGGDFISRIKHWLPTVGGGKDAHPVQLATVCEAGVTINLGQMQKEREKFKEMATKHKQVCDKLLAISVITPTDYQSMKNLKHIDGVNAR